MRGSKLEGLGAVWDWYATFAQLAGVDPTDHAAAAAGLPPVDSVSLWPYLSGAQPLSPRTVLAIGSSSCEKESVLPTECVNQWGWGDTTTIVSGLIEDAGEGEGLWKLLIGEQTQNGWQGPLYPNRSTANGAFAFNDAFTAFCGETGCLFRLDTDPEERHNLLREGAKGANATVLARAQRMMIALRKHNSTTFSPERGVGESDKKVVNAACKAGIDRYGGFFGPFVNSTTNW